MVGAGTDRSKPQLQGGPAIVLVRPQLAVNIGMSARAMANFGLGDLRLGEALRQARTQEVDCLSGAVESRGVSRTSAAGDGLRLGRTRR